MNLRQLAKETQELFIEGIANIYIWKEGRSWNWKAFWYTDPVDEIYSFSDQEEISNLSLIDPYVINLNGYEEVAGETLAYIEARIKFEREIVGVMKVKLIKVNTAGGGYDGRSKNELDYRDRFIKAAHSKEQEILNDGGVF